MILRNKTQSQFTIVDNNILKDPRLKLKDRGLLITLLSLPDNWEFSVSGLTKIIPDGQKAIQTGLKNLEQYGYLKRTKLKDKKGQFYDVLWEIFERPENAILPGSENAYTENSHTENRPQSITNISNNYLSNTNNSILSADKQEKIRRDLIISTGIEYLLKEDITGIYNDVFNVMLDVMISNKSYYIIAGQKIPTSIFRQRIDNYDYETIRDIGDRIAEIDTPIKNIKNYILAALYNYSNTVNTYYQNRLKSDGVI